MPSKKVTWNDKLTTELRSIDNDHKVLIEAFNEFVDAINAEEPTDKLCEMFQGVIDEVVRHFAFEEKVMLNIGYKGYIEHKQHHANLCADAAGILEELKAANSAKDTLPSVNFLRALVVKHMVEQDLKIKEFVMRDV
ncbi:bacteriohemerythrin [Terasakiella sp. A23]|uniref:bacteriohemerythrin n=1 Tax=Terasakiella sp. FCG-A23 TaxID=3080561 RepID=UPI00295475A5|nr:bacteriohemerythrin [Terasakiella sp. A23]MDV7339236.1 bacteriohemerythrin [Terasakiella sp. A23]